jgi:hypothetical protein
MGWDGLTKNIITGGLGHLLFRLLSFLEYVAPFQTYPLKKIRADTTLLGFIFYQLTD